MLRRGTRIVLTLLLALAAGPTACGDDGTNSQSDTAPDESGGDAGPGGEDSAFLVYNRVQTPDSRSLFASVVPRLDAGEIDLSNSLEIGGFSRVRVFDGKVYSFNGESGEVTRWVLDDDNQLQKDTLSDGETTAKFSMAGEGVTGFSTTLAFVDSETAYYLDFFFGQSQVIKWNPTEMTIDNTIQVPEMQKEGLDAQAKQAFTVDDRVVMPITWADFQEPAIREKASLAVFSASTGELEQIVEDDRCIGSRQAFPQDGEVHTIAENVRGLIDLATPDTDFPPPCLIRWAPGESEFDQDFFVDLESLVDSSLLTGAIGRGDGTMVALAYTSEQDPSEFGLREILSRNLWQWVFVNFEEETATTIDSIPRQGVSALGWVIDEQYLVPRFDADAGETSLYRVDSSGGSEKMLTVDGEIFFVDKIR